MNVLNDLIRLSCLSKDEEKSIWSFSINKDHKTFEGHFPDQPVLPGVALLESIKVAMENITDQELILSTSRSIKFLNMISPELSGLELSLTHLSNNDLPFKVKALLADNDKTYFKADLQYTSIS